MPKIPSLLELLEAGVHFGHQKSKGHPKMKPYVYSVSGGIQIINLEKTVERLEEILEFIKNKVSEGAVVLFVGTKNQIKKIIEESAKQVKMPYVAQRWLGGTITNFSVILKLIDKLKKMEEAREKGDWQKYTKKEQSNFNKKIEKLENIVGGLKDLKKIPEIVFIIDLKKEKTALEEARALNIPIVAIIDTNTNPEKVTYPIPANDDGIKSLKMIINLVKEAIEEGLSEKKKEVEKRVDKPKEKKE